MSSSECFARAVALIDAANSADTHQTMIDGKGIPDQLLYSQRMTAWLEKLKPDASEALWLAARAQHIRRWEIPRSSYPATRAGYHQWRTRLYHFHAQRAGEILQKAGYDQALIERVKALLQKERLKTDPEMQLLEDVICLVFLESYFAEFAASKDQEKLIGIIQKTWKKMSPQAHSAALKLSIPPEARALVEKALDSQT